ncbi:MAG: hypothetical protein ACRC4T_21020 [Cetobacterium sp.]
MKLQPEWKDAAYFITSMRLAYYEVRMLEKGEIEFILERAKELKINNVKEYIDFIKNNKRKIKRRG